MRNLVFIILAFLLFGCMSRPSIQSELYTQNKLSEYQLYDSKSQIRYKVSNDSVNLYLTLNTNSRATIIQMLKGGLAIYFDTLGKKNKDISFQYPLAESERPAQTSYKMPNNMQHPSYGASGQMLKLPKKAVYQNGSMVKQYNVKSLDNDIKIVISSTGESEIEYLLTIPLKRISKQGLLGLNKLSIGVFSQKITPESRSQQASQSGGMKGKGNGGGGGGRKQGRSGGGMEQPNQNSMKRASQPVDIKFWFNVVLAK